jgi:hypothetical protein
MKHTFHPFTPFHPSSVFQSPDIQLCQDRIYYLTSRFRAILLERKNYAGDDAGWSAHMAFELVSVGPGTECFEI